MKYKYLREKKTEMLGPKTRNYFVKEYLKNKSQIPTQLLEMFDLFFVCFFPDPNTRNVCFGFCMVYLTSTVLQSFCDARLFTSGGRPKESVRVAQADTSSANEISFTSCDTGLQNIGIHYERSTLQNSQESYCHFSLRTVLKKISINE